MTSEAAPPQDHDPAPSHAGSGTPDPLLARAERLGELPLDERPAAFQRLNAALVDELNRLEEV